MRRRWRTALAVLLVAGCARDAPKDEPTTAPRSSDGPAIGATIDSFAFVSPDGGALAWDSRAARFTVGDQTASPAALVIHVFQPDCNACQAQAAALGALHRELSDRGIRVTGVTHRGTAADLAKFVGEYAVPFPVAAATDSAWARTWGRGDPLYITDRAGRVVYAQTGFQESDAFVWRAVLDDVVQGRPPSFREPQRSGERLATGDRLPPIDLPDLVTGRPMRLLADADAGGLWFSGVDGERRRFRASIGFFSRYWAFSREEMVHLQRLHEQFAAKGLFVYAIAMHDDPTVARRLNEELGVKYPVFLGNGSELGERFAYGWPAYITDAGGVIRHTQVGFESGDEELYTRLVQELLAAPSEGRE